jgi:hypothetical protein
LVTCISGSSVTERYLFIVFFGVGKNLGDDWLEIEDFSYCGRDLGSIFEDSEAWFHGVSRISYFVGGRIPTGVFGHYHFII